MGKSREKWGQGGEEKEVKRVRMLDGRREWVREWQRGHMSE